MNAQNIRHVSACLRRNQIVDERTGSCLSMGLLMAPSCRAQLGFAFCLSQSKHSVNRLAGSQHHERQ